MIWDTNRKNRSFWTRELTFPLYINKHLIQFIQKKIITLLISLSEHRNSESKILKTRLSETLIEVIFPCQPQHSTTSLLIYRTNNIKVAYKNPRGGFPTITTSYNISPSSLFFRRTIISINDWGIEVSNIITQTWIIWSEQPTKSTLTTSASQHTQIQSWH